MGKGVRQGCPLSPLLFVAAVDILLRRLAAKIPDCSVRAFADDLGAVFPNWEEHSAAAHSIFTEFGAMSGLNLNKPKTVVIPLWEGGMEALLSDTSTTAEGWKDLKVSMKGTYLGFEVGPGKGNSSWDAPIKKYLSRCNSWSTRAMGLHYATMAHNVYAFSTLTYIAQLENLPGALHDTILKGINKFIPGPGNWISIEDVVFFKELYGQSSSFKSIEFTHQAAKLRVVHNHNRTCKVRFAPLSPGDQPKRLTVFDMTANIDATSRV